MKLMVIDGNSIINRSFYGVRPLTTREGLPTNAVYGFVTTLQKLLEEEKPEALCVTFDRREPTFRHLEYDGYKAQRKGMPEELAAQMPILKEVLDAMDVPRYELAGFEADDLIGTISRRCEAAGWECVVVTGDKDSLQLITDHTKVKLVSTRMGQTTTRDMTPETFREAYGFDPIHIIDLKALMGDASDNIPGVKGVGEKTAMALVQRYQTVDALYAAMPEVEAKPAAVKKLAEGEDSARMSCRLATIVTDAPLDFNPEANLRRPAKPELYQVFLRLEFNKLIEKMGLSAQETPAAAVKETDFTVQVEQVTEEAQAEKLLELFRKADHTALLALPDLTAVAVQCETGENTAVLGEFYFHRYRGDWNGLLAKLFAGDIRKVSHDVKDLTRTLLENSLPAEGFLFDTALAGYLLDATAGHYDIARLFASWFKEELPKPVYLEPDAFTALGSPAGSEAVFNRYTAAVEALYGAMLPKLEETGVKELYFTIELPLCRVLAEMELAGFRVDAGALRSFGDTLTAAIETLEQQIYSYAGKFNINSPKQLGEVLFERLGMPHGKRTKTGWSTNAEVLEKLRGAHPIVGEVLEYRQYAKLKSTYVDGLLKVISPDGRVRTSFQMTVTATGRLSSTEPNLQNIPTRTELGSELRRMFSAEPGKVLVDADYSQIELRLLAHISGDEAMEEAFLSGEDFHTVTASQVFGVPVADVTGQMRRAAKAVNFGIVYGISAFSLSQDLAVSVQEAKAYMDAYFERFPGVKGYMDSVIEKAREDGYVETLFHRRRALPEIKASNFNTRSFGERVALNMPIQGTAADIIKLAMVKVFDRLKKEKLEARLIMQVHDELIVECPEGEEELVKKLLTEEMEGVYKLAVPLTAEAHSGKNWLEAK
ncbi:MAG: DNA polymerase I [Oscillospiraceae bacterium]|jgi:DNA polymerase-1|nr:DNA polymerase I [Oscillospiraceae bacterium]